MAHSSECPVAIPGQGISQPLPASEQPGCDSFLVLIAGVRKRWQLCRAESWKRVK